jgi:uncharacterized membrane protein
MNVERVSVDSERGLVLVSYVLHLVGAVTGVLSIIGLILNYVRRNQPGTPFADHHTWMIRSFWWAILWGLIGCVLLLIWIGWIVLGLVWLWYLYRHVRGLIALVNGDRLPV